MFKLDLSKFKKVSSDKKCTKMKHADGHVIEVAHSALSPKMRSQLHALPIHKEEGGEIEEFDSKDFEKDIKASDEGEKETKREPKANKEEVESDVSEEGSVDPRFADGGEVEQPKAITLNINTTPQQAQIPESMVNPAPGAQFEASHPTIQPASVDPGSLPYGITPDMVQQPVYPVQPQRAPAVQQPGLDQAVEDAVPSEPAPSIESAYQKQVEGLTAESRAQQQQAGAEQQALQQHIERQNKIMADYDLHHKELLQERQDLLHDINNSHINPDKYWENHSKVNAALGLILAGFNPSGNHNAASDFLNKQIDNSIKAQQADLDKKNNLLSANLRQFGNLKDAVDMTRVMQADIISNQLKMAAAKSTSPISKARALQEAGKLEAQYAPMFQQVAMRRALASGNISGRDPAEFVAGSVPKERQDSVFKEIERAQNTKHMGNNIMKAFEEAAKENTIMKTGAGLLRTPGSVYALHQHLQPTFQDLEGTVRQAAMDNTFKNITPTPGDSEHTIEQKRETLKEYLKSKASAPTAKGFGIDLEKFESTTTNPEVKLNDQQKSFLKWARANPENPKAKLVFKKLGISE